MTKSGFKGTGRRWWTLSRRVSNAPMVYCEVMEITRVLITFMWITALITLVASVILGSILRQNIRRFSVSKNEPPVDPHSKLRGIRGRLPGVFIGNERPPAHKSTDADSSSQQSYEVFSASSNKDNTETIIAVYSWVTILLAGIMFATLPIL